MTETEYRKPILLKIVQKVGLPLAGVRLQVLAPEIQGFLAIESQDIKGATQYIALDNIASFTVIDEEAVNIYDMFPIPKVNVRAD